MQLQRFQEDSPVGGSAEYSFPEIDKAVFNKNLIEYTVLCIYTITYMWEIYEKHSLIKELRRLPREIKRNYEVWKRIVELEGPQGLRLIKGFHDEALKGEWLGFRSSRLNLKWRVIYKIEAQQLQVYVFDINPHTY